MTSPVPTQDTTIKQERERGMEKEAEEISRALYNAKVEQEKGARKANLKALDVLHSYGWTAEYEEDADGCFWINRILKLG